MASSHLTSDCELAVRIMSNSLAIQSHFQLLLWMQGDFQEAVAHDVMISFTCGNHGEPLHYDIVSALPGIRTIRFPLSSIDPLRIGLHRRWQEGGGQVASATMQNDARSSTTVTGLSEELQEMKHVLFHATADTRQRADHLYILLRRNARFNERERKLFELMLPHVDAAVRKIEELPICEPDEVTAHWLLNSLIRIGLTPREIEILEWVRTGKTNAEIGLILQISACTVKNHLQRIFKKSNVTNRAQAVGKLDQLAQQGLSEALASLA